MPIFRAWVSTWRYRLRRAATPTVSRSGGASWVGVCNTTQGFFQKQQGWCVGPSQSPSAPPSLCELLAQRFGVDEVHELPLPVDLDDGDQLAVARLELLVAVDRDLLELEAELLLRLDDRRPRAIAEVATLRAVEPDAGYGYSPRVVVASATRFTASP